MLDRAGFDLGSSSFVMPPVPSRLRAELLAELDDSTIELEWLIGRNPVQEPPNAPVLRSLLEETLTLMEQVQGESDTELLIVEQGKWHQVKLLSQQVDQLSAAADITDIEDEERDKLQRIIMKGRL